eukprot:873944-Pleurochrysis_carterae.AAC.1
MWERGKARSRVNVGARESEGAHLHERKNRVRRFSQASNLVLRRNGALSLYESRKSQRCVDVHSGPGLGQAVQTTHARPATAACHAHGRTRVCERHGAAACVLPLSESARVCVCVNVCARACGRACARLACAKRPAHREVCDLLLPLWILVQG